MTDSDIAAFLTDQLDEDQRLAEAYEYAEMYIDYQDDDARAFREAFDEKRVLADVAANRAIVNHCVVMAAHAIPGSAMAQFCENILLRVAAPYAERPGFRPEWKIDG